MKSSSVTTQVVSETEGASSGVAAVMPFYPIVVAPFPDLPCSVSPPNSNSYLAPRKDAAARCCPLKAKRRSSSNPSSSASSKVKKSSSSSMAQTAATTTSAPISLPETHIRRTPSENRLEALERLAEHEDVRMYSRLLCGMQDQIRRRRFATGGEDVEIHPLSRKSLQGIVRTKLEENEDRDQDDYWNKQHYQEEGAVAIGNNAHGHDDDDGDVGWDISYIPINDEHENCSMGSSSADAYAPPPTGQGRIEVDDMDTKDQEDDCVFSMEL